MAWTQHYRHRFIDHIREQIGDRDGLLFTEDQLKSYIDKWMCTQLTTATPNTFNNRYRICGCCAPGREIYQLEVTVGLDDATYILDEMSATVLFDPDADSAPAAPADNTNITVTFYQVDKAALLSELFLELSSSHAKLQIIYDMSEMKMDLKALRKGFYDQSVIWAAEAVC